MEQSANLWWLFMATGALVALGCIVKRRWWRTGPARGVPFEPMEGFLLAFGMIVMAAVGAQLALSFLGNEEPDPTDLKRMVVIGAAAAVMQAGFIVLGGLRRRETVARFGASRSAIIGVVALLFAWPIVDMTGRLVMLILTELGAGPFDTIAHETLRAMVEAPRDGWFLGLALLVTIAVPICEEVLYRGFIQNAVRGLGASPWIAIVATSFIFALMHVGPAQPNAVAALFVLSLAFGWAYERTGRLVAPIVMHAIFNGLNLVIGLTST